MSEEDSRTSATGSLIRGEHLQQLPHLSVKKATQCTCLVSVAPKSHLLLSQTCLQGDCCTSCKSHNLSFPFSEESIQNSLLLYIISYFGFCFSDLCYLCPLQGSSLNEIKRIFLYCQQNYVFPPLQKKKVPFQSCNRHKLSPLCHTIFFEGVGGEWETLKQ